MPDFKPIEFTPGPQRPPAVTEVEFSDRAPEPVEKPVAKPAPVNKPERPADKED